MRFIAEKKMENIIANKNGEDGFHRQCQRVKRIKAYLITITWPFLVERYIVCICALGMGTQRFNQTDKSMNPVQKSFGY